MVLNAPTNISVTKIDIFFCTWLIRALVSARGSEKKNGKKQKQTPRLKSRLPVPLYVFMTKIENRNFQGLIKQFPPNRFI